MSEAELYVMQALMRSAILSHGIPATEVSAVCCLRRFRRTKTEDQLSDVTTDSLGQASILGRTCSIEPS